MDPDDGCQWTKVEYPIWGIAREGTAYDPFDWSEIPPDSIYSRDLERKVYELTDHLGNARVVLKDWKKSTGTVGVRPYEASIGQYSNIYPFGMEHPGRSWSGGVPYRYGYNGMETSPETGGENYTTYFRQYDARIGRWMSTDPVTHEWESPYAAMGNNPIVASDPFGADTTFSQAPNGDRLRTFNVGDKTKTEVEVDGKWELYLPPRNEITVSASREVAEQAVSVEEIAEEPLVHDVMSGARVSNWELAATIVLDFIPGVGTAKGIVEAISGEDLVTGEELTTFERSTGWFPIAGKVGRGIKNIGKLSRAGSKLRRGTKVLREYRPVIGVVKEGGEHVDDAENAAKAITRTEDVAKATDKANDAADAANRGANLRYSPTKKHQKGGWGTEMELDDATANTVLNNSIQGGNQRYGYYGGKLYEFQPDNVGGWHGYPIKGTEAPPSVLKELKNSGVITSSQYKRFLKGK